MELRLQPFETDPSQTSTAPDQRCGAETAANEPVAVAPDRFVTAAKREYERGHVDPRLWTTAVALADGDQTAALAAYLRARAASMRLADASTRSTAAAAPRDSLPPEGAAAEPDRRQASASPASDERRRQRLRVAWMVGVSLTALGTAAWIVLAPTGGTESPAAAGAAPVPVNATTQARGGAVPTALTAADLAAEAARLRAEREAKVRELLAAGNWNVLVLHAAEWTRREPTNAEAWKHLSVGYANLKQSDEAFGAAEKATELAPKDRDVWKNLGRVGMQSGRIEAAVQAFEQAVALDAQDLGSQLLVGRLSLQLGRLPQAKLAYDQAAAVSPDNADAQCGQVQVARKQGRSRDVETLAKELRRVGHACDDMESVAPPPAAPALATTTKAVPPRGR